MLAGFRPARQDRVARGRQQRRASAADPWTTTVASKCAVTLEPVAADRLVHCLAQPVDAADGAMLRQCMPGVEAEVVAGEILLGAVEVLRRKADVGDRLEWRDGLVPLDAGVSMGM